MVFFGSQWQSIIMDLLSLLYPELQSGLSQYRVSAVGIWEYYPSEVVVSLATLGQTTSETVGYMHVNLEVFSSALTTILGSAKYSPSEIQVIDLTADEEK